MKIASWLCLLAAGMVLSQAKPVLADSTLTGSQSTPNIAIQGYDVVSYFTDGHPEKGQSDIATPFDDSLWQFANASHKEMFTADPARYMPQYGGMCAGGMALGVEVQANPENWVIIDGRLYMVAGTKVDLDDWVKNAAENIKKADANWAKLHQ